jgi:hypothetical protein
MTDEEIVDYLKDFFNTGNHDVLKILADSMLIDLMKNAAFLNAYSESTTQSDEVIEEKIMQRLKCDSEDDLIYLAISRAENLNREIMVQLRNDFNNNTLNSDIRDYFESHMDELQSDMVPGELYDPLCADTHELPVGPIIDRVFSKRRSITRGPIKPF